VPVGERDVTNAYIVFNEVVPNGRGVLLVVLDDGRKVRLTMIPVNHDVTAATPTEEGGLPEGALTKSLRTQWSPKAQGFTPSNLAGRPARLYSDDYPNQQGTMPKK
jgi:hypothetical protein